MMAGIGAGGVPLVHGAARTGVGDTGWRGGLSGVSTEVTIVTLGGSAVGRSLGTFGEGSGQSGWTSTGGAGRGAMRAGAVGGIAVTLEKMRESVWMALNLSSLRVANGVEVGCKRALASAQAAAVAALVELMDGMGQS